MARSEAKAKFGDRPDVTVPTEGEYKGTPTLSIPDPTNVKFPITMGVRKWREVMKHRGAIEAFLAKHPETESESEEELCAKLGITPEQLAGMRKAA